MLSGPAIVTNMAAFSSTCWQDLAECVQMHPTMKAVWLCLIGRRFCKISLLNAASCSTAHAASRPAAISRWPEIVSKPKSPISTSNTAPRAEMLFIKLWYPQKKKSRYVSSTTISLSNMPLLCRKSCSWRSCTSAKDMLWCCGTPSVCNRASSTSSCNRHCSTFACEHALGLATC